jgi:hypothetical protein
LILGLIIARFAPKLSMAKRQCVPLPTQRSIIIGFLLFEFFALCSFD